ncbi:hypothetical protein MPL1032_250036 [Mesorhizobium plurifarium]|uniref:Uncharacterized protein n=1 Tax=Mesorhizobium plurifarium TaxID=69974 RepID=A0A0K2W143_MESPL|nr:hypothetical protein MPL1032_250036 [Mesorhizobium plurifarium]
MRHALTAYHTNDINHATKPLLLHYYN